jgi:tRNA-uridine 2-sulfurtransferase
MAKVLVGMSGGVDSSVAVYLLKQQGFEVEGLSFILWDARNRPGPTACCSLEAVSSASSTAEKLGIRHAALDVRGEFIEKVVEPFVEAYTKGMTPNPCILCNRHIKFPFLIREAEKQGAGYIATGHYARVVQGSGFGTEGSGSPDPSLVTCRSLLLKGIDPKKDQSYVLYALGQETLDRLVLPLGDYRKEDVRTIARSLSLPAADRPESQEICFIEYKNYFEFIEKLWPTAGEPGPILDMEGKVLGTHRGLYRYTIGQRKGLGIYSPEPHYVIKIDAAKNALCVGSREDAKPRTFIVEDVSWLLAPQDNCLRAAVKLRSTMEARPASLEIIGDGVKVIFDEPQWASAPGQSAVFYQGDAVIGGGVIGEGTLRRDCSLLLA